MFRPAGSGPEVGMSPYDESAIGGLGVRPTDTTDTGTRGKMHAHPLSLEDKAHGDRWYGYMSTVHNRL